jgi:hypothetical protein
MMYRGRTNILLFIIKPLLIGLLIFGVFGLVYLRSSFVKLEYTVGDLEKRKTSCLSERKMLLAEKTSLLSFAKLEESPDASEGFVLPDRIRVIHVDKQSRSLPYRASLERSQLTEP